MYHVVVLCCIAVISFRGTEQVKWKDLATDLNLTPTSLNTERVNDDAALPAPLRILKAVVPNEQVGISCLHSCLACVEKRQEAYYDCFCKLFEDGLHYAGILALATWSFHVPVQDKCLVAVHIICTS